MFRTASFMERVVRYTVLLSNSMRLKSLSNLNSKVLLNSISQLPSVLFCKRIG